MTVEFVNVNGKFSKLLLGATFRGDTATLNLVAQMYAPGPYTAYLIEGQDTDDTIWVKLAIQFDNPASEEALLWRLKWL